jgi:hypothetical protein
VGDSADILVTDQGGNRTGFDAATGSIVKQIPQSAYTRDFLTDDETGQQTTGVTHL